MLRAHYGWCRKEARKWKVLLASTRCGLCPRTRYIKYISLKKSVPDMKSTRQDLTAKLKVIREELVRHCGAWILTFLVRAAFVCPSVRLTLIIKAQTVSAAVSNLCSKQKPKLFVRVKQNKLMLHPRNAGSLPIVRCWTFTKSAHRPTWVFRTNRVNVH